MLIVSITLKREKLESIINQYHLEVHKDTVYHWAKLLCKEIKVEIYYKAIDKDTDFILNSLNQQSEKSYKKGMTGIITLGNQIDKVLEDYKEHPLVIHIIDILSNEILLEGLYAFKEQYINANKINGLSVTYFPGNHLPIEINQDIIRLVDTEGKVSLNEQYMMTPLNTISFVYGEENNKVEESNLCSRCDRMNCPNRKNEIDITIIDGYKIKKIKGIQNNNLLKTLNDHQIYITQSCSGQKQCGKCRVKVLTPNFSVNPVDEQFLSEEAIKQGVRCACGIVLNQPITISLIQEKETDNKNITISAVGETKKSYGIAVDLGTTTVEMALIDLETKQQLAVLKEENHQKKFGLDVLSRAYWTSINTNGKEMIKKTIVKQLNNHIKEICAQCKINDTQVTKTIISANTVMTHLLLGLDTEKVVVAPFEPVTKAMQVLTGQCLNLSHSMEVIVLPTIASFIGSDVLSGMIATHMNGCKRHTLLIDLGTNGEIVLGKEDHFLSCSTAVGPAFEGTHIEKGMGALKGAIHAWRSPLEYETIGEVEPVGICGSGIIDVIDYLLEQNIMDSTGLLKNNEKGYNITKDIELSQQDIRHIQMAKSAVYTGIEILVEESGIDYADIQNVYITGGFGEYINIKKAGNIGLIPKQLIEVAQPLHNTSLQGAIKALMDRDILNLYEAMAKKITYIELANTPQFERVYIKNINF
ncbi:uncharacterized 2Fe-2S/4Fe-4S cluster protein (DUF4445 family) [Natranaerovirga hydrolytica]|uniref:Uncharacterized 2Fe-2S/4Fe-4S cluster protein (DUF4445 family) n=1 Tax=Natranaerovirga hydrolytica TaxID=680378 RepID=A0A4R1MYR2_9FIRM|nr:ASKHA domain-containing protein [Natranaerovirga hydrolytica]TCK98447.1 uncharacterized 2Fe-2S/4Fe-4S cluster protein (DUF4445 family) [Natranaerovirga hydrolytica]